MKCLLNSVKMNVKRKRNSVNKWNFAFFILQYLLYLGGKYALRENRMNMKKKKAIWIMSVIMVLLLSGCSMVQQSGKVIRVGVRESVPGFGYKNPVSETYSGMEVDLAQRLAKALGYDEVKYVGVTADTREQVLRDDQVDFVVATFTITEERQQEFDFSSPYYANNLQVMVQNSSMIRQLSDLKDKKIGVSSGSTTALYLAQEMAARGIIPEFDEAGFQSETFRGGVSFVNIDTYPLLNSALEEGSVDAICTDSSILRGYLNDERILLPDEFMEQHFGVCTTKGSALSGKIQAQIEQWSSDGQLDELLIKWDLK